MQCEWPSYVFHSRMLYIITVTDWELNTFAYKLNVCCNRENLLYMFLVAWYANFKLIFKSNKKNMTFGMMWILLVCHLTFKLIYNQNAIQHIYRFLSHWWNWRINKLSFSIMRTFNINCYLDDILKVSGWNSVICEIEFQLFCFSRSWSLNIFFA